MYLRVNRNPYDNITPEGAEFVPGEPVVLKEGTDVAVFACGIMTVKALEAAKALEGRISVKVVNVPSIKPLNRESVIAIAKSVKGCVTAEEHSVIGGLGSAVCDVLSAEAPTKVLKIGINDVYGESGPAAQLIKKYGLDGDSIYEKVKAFC
jgi:transketolase